MLTEKQRLLDAIIKGNSSRPPCICPGGMMNMAVRDLMEESHAFFPQAHTDPQIMARLSRAAYEMGCFENYGVPFCMTIEAEQMGAEVDLGTKTYEPRVKKYAINSADEWQKLAPLDVNGGRAKVVLEAIKMLKENNDTVPVIGNIPGPVSVATSIMEPSDYYKGQRKKNTETHQLMHFISEQLIEFSKAQAAAGADIITIAEPSGTGEILGPKFFEEFAVKYLNIIIDTLKKEYPNVPIIVHICGRMHNVFDQVSQLRCEVLSFDSLVSTKIAKTHLPNHAIMGNVSTYTLEYGLPDKVCNLTLKSVADGVDIIAPACGLGNKSPLANLQAILKAVT